MPLAPVARSALILAALLALTPAPARAAPPFAPVFDFATSPGHCCGATQALARLGNDLAVAVTTDFGGYVTVRDVTTGGERGRLSWPDPSRAFLFGSDVDTSPSGLLVGAPFVLEGEGGAAFVYRSLASLAPELTFVSPEAGVADVWFGKAVAWVGHDVVIGDPQLVYPGGPGVAHLFDGRTGAHRARLASPDPRDGAAFGNAVAACHSGVAVAEPGNWTLAGAVHFFDRDGAHRQTLTAPVAASGDVFGAALACAGRWIAIGAPGTAGGGAVHLAKRERGQWRIVRTLAGGPHGATGLGASVALEGRRLLAGSSASDTAYLFDARSGALLAGFAVPFDPDELIENPYPNFGADVAFVGRTLVVGSETYDENYRAHVFAYRAGGAR
jgi:hypothetical protein